MNNNDDTTYDEYEEPEFSNQEVRSRWLLESGNLGRPIRDKDGNVKLMAPSPSGSGFYSKVAQSVVPDKDGEAIVHEVGNEQLKIYLRDPEQSMYRERYLYFKAMVEAARDPKDRTVPDPTDFKFVRHPGSSWRFLSSYELGAPYPRYYYHPQRPEKLSPILPPKQTKFKGKGRVSRPTTYLTTKDVMRALEARAFANWRGFALSAFLTINFSLLGFEDKEADRRFALWRERASKWLLAQRLPWLGIFVWERGRDNGLHVHFVFHCPRSLIDKFRAWAELSIAYVCGLNTVPEKSVHLKGAKDELFGQDRVLRYMLKGIHPKATLRCRKQRRKLRLVEDGKFKSRKTERIEWQRLGVTESIGPAARAQASKKRGYRSYFADGLYPGFTLFNKAYFGDGAASEPCPEAYKIVSAIMDLNPI